MDTGSHIHDSAVNVLARRPAVELEKNEHHFIRHLP